MRNISASGLGLLIRMEEQFLHTQRNDWAVLKIADEAGLDSLMGSVVPGRKYYHQSRVDLITATRPNPLEKKSDLTRPDQMMGQV